MLHVHHACGSYIAQELVSSISAFDDCRLLLMELVKEDWRSNFPEICIP